MTHSIKKSLQEKHKQYVVYKKSLAPINNEYWSNILDSYEKLLRARLDEKRDGLFERWSVTLSLLVLMHPQTERQYLNLLIKDRSQEVPFFEIKEHQSVGLLGTHKIKTFLNENYGIFLALDEQRGYLLESADYVMPPAACKGQHRIQYAYLWWYLGSTSVPCWFLKKHKEDCKKSIFPVLSQLKYKHAQNAKAQLTLMSHQKSFATYFKQICEQLWSEMVKSVSDELDLESYEPFNEPLSQEMKKRHLDFDTYYDAFCEKNAIETVSGGLLKAVEQKGVWRKHAMDKVRAIDETISALQAVCEPCEREWEIFLKPTQGVVRNQEEVLGVLHQMERKYGFLCVQALVQVYPPLCNVWIEECIEQFYPPVTFAKLKERK